MTDYTFLEYVDGSNVSVCQTLADTFWSKTFFLGGTLVFFALPLAILVVLYSVIAVNLMTHPGIVPLRRLENPTSAQKYRKKVVMMLATVVTFFFVCLLPFRALIVWIVVAPHEEIMALGNEGYYTLLYFCRIMFYLNSAINPILYNLMSSKFRNGFFKLCGIRKSCFKKHKRGLLRRSTFNTSSLTAITTSSIHRPSFADQDRRRKFFGDFPSRRCPGRRSFLLCGAPRGRPSRRRHPEHLRMIKRVVRRRSFSDYLYNWETSTTVLKHSHSMDSVLKGSKCRTTRKKKSSMKGEDLKDNAEGTSGERKSVGRCTVRKVGSPKKKNSLLRKGKKESERKVEILNSSSFKRKKEKGKGKGKEEDKGKERESFF